MGSIIAPILNALKGLIKPELLKVEAAEIAALQADVANASISPLGKQILAGVVDFLDKAEQAAIDVVVP